MRVNQKSATRVIYHAQVNTFNIIFPVIVNCIYFYIISGEVEDISTNPNLFREIYAPDFGTNNLDKKPSPNRPALLESKLNVTIDCNPNDCNTQLSSQKIFNHFSHLHDFKDMIRDGWFRKADTCSSCPCSITDGKVLKCEAKSVFDFPMDIFKLCPELDLYKLEVIDLNDQSITVLKATKAMQGFTKVMELNLNDNNLTQIEEGALDYLINLREISLKNNSITKYV